MNKEKKKTFIEVLQNSKKNIPPPNKYESWIRPKVLGNYKLS